MAFTTKFVNIIKNRPNTLKMSFKKPYNLSNTSISKDTSIDVWFSGRKDTLVSLTGAHSSLVGSKEFMCVCINNVIMT